MSSDGGDGSSENKVRCDVCNVTVTSESCMLEHLRGRRHRNKAAIAYKQAMEAKDPIKHAQVLTNLRSMMRTHNKDKALDWLADQLLLTPEERQQRDQLCSDLQTALRSRFPTCLVKMFGSSVNGLGFRGCDLDLYANLGTNSHGLQPDADDEQKMKVVAQILEQLTQLCTNIMRIPYARVPIVKFSVPQFGNLQCDMSFRDSLSCHKSQLIGWLMKADPRAQPVMVAIRYWAKRRNLAGGDHHPKKMTSYCLTLLVVTFLQQLDQPVLPTVHWCQASVEQLLIGPWNAAFNPDAVWRSTNTTPASKLLRQFFQFYAMLVAKAEALCPLLGETLKRSQLTDGRAGRRLTRPAVWTGLCGLAAADTALLVQDPIELNYNVARNYSQLGLNHFHRCCREAANMPIDQLFREQPLASKMRKGKEAAAAKAASVVAAAATAADSVGRAAVADLCWPPSRAVTVPLEDLGRRGPLTKAERSRYATAFANLLEEVFSVAMRFECHTMTFDDLSLDIAVVRGYTCSVRLPVWQFRNKVTDAMEVGRQQMLEFESEVTEEALRRAGQPAPAPLATFSCYLVLVGDQLLLRLHEGETGKAGKNCHPFLASFLQKLSKRYDCMTLFGDDQPSEK